MTSRLVGRSGTRVFTYWTAGLSLSLWESVGSFTYLGRDLRVAMWVVGG